jgi:hypothetical protein
MCKKEERKEGREGERGRKRRETETEIETNELETDLTHFTKINSKWIIDLNVNRKIIKLLQGNKGENLDDTRYADDVSSTIKA